MYTTVCDGEGMEKVMGMEKDKEIIGMGGNGDEGLGMGADEYTNSGDG